MRKLFCIMAVAIIGAGLMNAAPCPLATVAVYLSTVNSAGGCTIGSLLFSNFQYSNFPNGPAIPLPATSANLQPIQNSNGIGLVFLPLVPWTASPTGRTDVILNFVAQAISGQNIITGLYMELAGSATGAGGSDVLTETYCPGGTTLPPDQLCPLTGGVQQRFLQITSGTSSPVSTLAPFPLTNSIAVSKDIDVRGINQAGTSTGTAQVTSMTNQISVVIPEPATVFLWGGGLFLIWARSRRRPTQ